MEHFTTERAVLDRLRGRLAERHEGEYAVLCGDRLVGVFLTSREAYRAGMHAAGLDKPFMMERIESRARIARVHALR
jgi:hypothetical protein